MLPLSSSEPSLGKKYFLQANEGKVIIIVNNYHAIHRLRDSISRNECLAVFAWYPPQQPPRHTNPCLFCVFVPLSPPSFRGAHRLLPQNAVEDMTFASVDCPCLFDRIWSYNMILCASVVACTPCNDHWRANVLICGQWVWCGRPFLIQETAHFSFDARTIKTVISRIYYKICKKSKKSNGMSKDTQSRNFQITLLFWQAGPQEHQMTNLCP